MSFRHGIYTMERGTSITPPVQISGNAGLCVAFGCAPIHLASSPAKANVPVIAYNYSEAVRQLGYSEDFEKYNLCEVMSTFFMLYNVAPVVFVNVFDPAKHYEEKTYEVAGISSTAAKLSKEIILGTLKVTSGEDKLPDELVKDTDYSVTVDINDEADSETTLQILSVDKVTDDVITYSYKTSRDTDTVIESVAAVEVGTKINLDSDTLVSTVKVVSGGTSQIELVEGEDYHAERDSDGTIVVSLIEGAEIVDDTIAISCHEAAPEKVTAWDIVGGIDTVSGDATGLELVEMIYPRLGVLPGIIIAPKYSKNSSVATVMKAKASLVNETFRALAIADISTEDAKSYTEAANLKALKNLVDTSLVVCYPKVSLDGVQYHLSTHMAALMNQVDANNSSIPYVSPSNHALQIDSTVREDGSEIYLSYPQANYLNGNGIVTAVNSSAQWRLWGNYTSLYPNSADPKDTFIAVRRMFNYVANSLVVSFFSRIDNPMNRRLIESITTSCNIWLDSLTAGGAILGGRCEFLTDNNSLTDLMSGKLNFNLYLTPPSPAQEIVYTLEYDANYLSVLFG